MFRIATPDIFISESSPILSPPMDSFHHLREQCIDTISDKTLKEMYAGFIVQVQVELLLKL